MSNYPKRGQLYTIEQINLLDLRDSPFLVFPHNDDGEAVEIPIQEFYQGNKTPEGFGETQWKYIRETEEWIPIFHWADSNTRLITDFVDVHKEANEFAKKGYDLMAYLKKP